MESPAFTIADLFAFGRALRASSREIKAAGRNILWRAVLHRALREKRKAARMTMVLGVLLLLLAGCWTRVSVDCEKKNVTITGGGVLVPPMNEASTIRASLLACQGVSDRR